MRHRFTFASLAVAACLAGPARAGETCAFATALPTYQAASAPDGRSYNAVAFPVRRGTTTETLSIAGQTCMQHYTPMDGTDPLSDVDIQTEYRAQLTDTGAELLFTDDRTTVARRRENGDETWIRIASQETTIDITVVRREPHAQVLTAPGANDFPLLGHMPDYVADTPDRREFDQRGFNVKEGDETREVPVQGARTDVNYALREGGRVASDLDIQENYRTALRAAGATILFTDDRNTVARFERAGQAIWLKVWSQENAINLTVIEQSAHRQTLLPAAGHDHRLLGHMPDYLAEPPEKRSLDEVVFPVQDDDDARDIKVQGARTDIAYAPRPGAMPASDLDIQTNYRAALEALGAQFLFTDSTTTVARLSDHGSLLWIKVWSQETAINLTFVEEQAFKSAVKPTPAEALRTALETRGRAGLYIAFDFNRPTTRAQAEPILAEIIRLLRETPALRLRIESHTDNLGPRARNLALASARAETIRTALIAGGIDPARLTTLGVGPDRPLAGNATSQGRARNRRIALVRQ